MSRTNRTNALLVSLMLAFILTLGLGVVVGKLASRLAPVPDRQEPAPQTRPATRPSLPDALGLDSEQREKLKAIWIGIDQGRKANFGRREKLVKERDETLFNLLTDEQKQQYQKVMSAYATNLADLNKEREKAIQDAVERTKQMLSPAQRETYDQILKDHPFPHGDHSQRGGGQRGHNGPGGFGSTRFGEPRTQPLRGGPTTEEVKENKELGTPATRPE